jgi:hypothetical protein
VFGIKYLIHNTTGGMNIIAGSIDLKPGESNWYGQFA